MNKLLVRVLAFAGLIAFLAACSNTAAPTAEEANLQTAQMDIPADIVFIIDESGSMGGVINAVENNVNFIANQLSTGGLDPRFALVEFGGRSTLPGNPGITTDLTDAAGLSTALATLVASGSFEPGITATILAADNISFRPGSGICYVLITDEDSDGGDSATAVSKLNAQSATFFAITNSSGTRSYGPIATQTGGQVFSISGFASDPQPVLDALNQACIGSIVQGINLVPPVASGTVGDTHTVTAIVKDSSNSPVVGTQVDFVITAGPNAGETFSGNTDASGQVAWTYTGDGGAGTDDIKASFVDQDGNTLDDTATMEWTGGGTVDKTNPECRIESIDQGPPVTLNVFTKDPDSGLASITILVDDNANVMIPSFTPGTNDIIMVKAEKIDQTKKSRVELEVTDVAGNVTRCDPVIVNLEIKADNKWGRSTVNVSNIPEIEGQVSVSNGAPGASMLRIKVNNGRTNVLRLADDQVVDYDASDDMHAGDNSASIVMHGEPGSSALVMFHDGSASDLANIITADGLSTQRLGASINLNWY